MQAANKPFPISGWKLPGQLTRKERIGLLILALGVGFWFWQREPSYEGKPLSHWLETFASIKNGIGWDEREREVTRVLQRTEGDVVPHLIRLLRKRNSVWDEPDPTFQNVDDGDILKHFRDKIHQWRPVPNWEMRHRAAEALGFIGQQARPAMSDLQRLMLQTDDYASSAAAEALGKIGGEGMSFLTGTIQQGTKKQKSRACWALSRSKELSTEAIESLEGALAADSFEVRFSAAGTLADFRLVPQKTARVILEHTGQGKPGDWGITSQGTPSSWVSGVLLRSLAQFDEPDLVKLYREQPAGNRKLIISLLIKDEPAQADALLRSVGNF